MSIKNKEIMIMDDHNNWQHFAGDVDNSNNLFQVRNLMIGSFFNHEGICKGVIQLVNKRNGIITDINKYEFEQLLPTVAQIISNVDSVRSALYVQKGIKM